MACCGGSQGPIKPNSVGKPMRASKTAVKEEFQKLAYCSTCGSVLMLIIITGRQRMQCTNHECRKIQK